MKKMTIAIDGPAASGKGSLAKMLADRLSLAHLDTGLLYRAIGLQALKQAIPLTEEEAIARVADSLSPQDLNNEDLRRDDVGQTASQIALHPQVRSSLLTFQRTFATTPPETALGCVLDGRDVGTEILPEADFKFYLTANAEERAKRRHKDLLARQEPASYETVLRDIIARDTRDQNRATAPLKPAHDAVLIDTSDKTPEEVLAEMLNIIEAKAAEENLALPKKTVSI